MQYKIFKSRLIYYTSVKTVAQYCRTHDPSEPISFCLSVFNSLPAIQHVASHLNLKSLSFCNAKRFQTQLKCFVLKEMLLASNSHPKNATLKRGFVACS